MKKKVMLFLCGVLLTACLTACGNDDAVATSKTPETETPTETTVVETTEKSEEVAPTTEEKKDETTEEVKEEVTEEIAEPEPETWITQQGITLRTEATGTYTTQTTTDGTSDLGTVPIPFTITMTETTEGVDPGYKKITLSIQEDMSPVPSGRGAYTTSTEVFDGYTGLVFSELAQVDTAGGQTGSAGQTSSISFGGMDYEVAIYKETTNNWPSVTSVVTVICPEEYDGLCFQFGYQDTAMYTAKNGRSGSQEQLTLDQLPNYGSEYDYYYFGFME